MDENKEDKQEILVNVLKNLKIEEYMKCVKLLNAKNITLNELINPSIYTIVQLKFANVLFSCLQTIKQTTKNQKKKKKSENKQKQAKTKMKTNKSTLAEEELSLSRSDCTKFRDGIINMQHKIQQKTVHSNVFENQQQTPVFVIATHEQIDSIDQIHGFKKKINHYIKQFETNIIRLVFFVYFTFVLCVSLLSTQFRKKKRFDT